MLITEFIHHAVGLWNCIVRCITKKEIQSHVIPTTEGCNNLYTTDVTNPGFFPTPRKRATFETVPKTKSADTSADIVVYHLCDLLKFLVFTFPFSRITSNRTVVGIAACRPYRVFIRHCERPAAIIRAAKSWFWFSQVQLCTYVEFHRQVSMRRLWHIPVMHRREYIISPNRWHQIQLRLFDPAPFEHLWPT